MTTGEVAKTATIECPMRVRPSQEYVYQCPGKKAAVGTALRETPRGLYIVRWDGERGVENVHGDMLTPAGDEEADAWVVVSAYGHPYVGHVGQTREEAIATHVSEFWSLYLDEFPEIPHRLERGRLSDVQSRAWLKSQRCGCRAVPAATVAD